MSTEPALILIGYGNGNGMQLTVEGESTLRRHGFAYSLNAPPSLVRYLEARGVDLDSVDDLLEGDKPWPDRLLDVADVVFRQVQLERPVCVLLPDNPLFLNPLARFLVAELRERKEPVAIVPGVSRFDIVISELGLDVGPAGLGILDAAQAVAAWPIPPTSPVLIFQVAALVPADLDRLVAQLRARYPEGHPMTLVNVGLGDRGTARATLPLSRLEESFAHVSAGACLFIPPIRPG